MKIGPGKLRDVGLTLKENNISGKILYIADPYVDGLYGNSVREQIEEIGVIKTEKIDHNSIAYAMSVAERVIATDVSCIVAMGGGKVLDVCKYASFISKVPLLSIATTVSNDGIASPIAVLKRQDQKPKSLGCATPTMLLVDTDIIATAPQALIKAGIGDTISNYTALKDWDLAVSRGKDVMNGYAYLMSQTALDALLKTQYDTINPEFIEVLVNSLVLSGIAMDFAGSSRPVSGAEHLFSHALDYYCEKQNLHGLNVALGTVAVLRLLEEDDSQLISYLKRFEVDINPKSMEIPEDTFIYCMQNAVRMRTNRYTCLNEMDLSADRIRKVYKELTEIL